jgi:glycosyltransferase involved in cell wall biosynthesis
MPKVSIVLPNYNYAQYLDERIQSLLNQTYRDFELIILDDASIDNSLEVIQKYLSDSRIKTQFYEQNSGLPYKRWNDGADLAQGEYLLFAGADDSCHPELLSQLVERLENHSSVGLAYTQSWNINGEGEKIQLCKEWTDDLDQVRWCDDFINVGRNECKYLLYSNTIPNASAVLMRRSVFIEAGKFDTQLRLSADWLLYAKILMLSDVAYISEPLNYFRSHANTVRNTTIGSVLELEERLTVVRYLLQGLQAPEPFWEEVFHPAVGWWVRLMASRKWSLSVNLRIYNILRDIDPNINYRLLRYGMEVLGRKAEYLTRLNRWQKD